MTFNPRDYDDYPMGDEGMYQKSLKKKAKSKALEVKKGQCTKCGKDHPTTGHSAATIYHTPTPGLEEWRKKNHPFKK